MAKKRTPESTAEHGYDDLASKNQQPGMFDPAYLLPRLLARWHWLLLGLLLGLGFGFFQLKQSVPLYRSTATLMVRDWNVTVMGQYDPADIDLRSKEAVETVRADFERSSLFEKVASDPLVRELPDLIPEEPGGLGSVFKAPKEAENLLTESAPPALVLAQMIRSWTSSDVPEESRFINVSVVHTSPVVAQVVTNRLVHHFIALREESKSSGALTTLEYLMSESERVGKELQNAQKLLGSYSAPLEAEKAMIEAEKTVSDLSVRYLHKHPKMKDAERGYEICKKDLLEKLSAAVTNPLDQEHWQQFKEQLSDPGNEKTFNEMRRLLLARKSTLDSEIESRSTLYKSLLERVQTKQVTAERAESEVIPKEAGQLPIYPFAPDAKSILMKASAMGLFFGLGLAFLFQFLDNKIHTAEQVSEFFGLPPLAVVHRLPDESELAQKKAHLSKLPNSLAKIAPALAITNWGNETHFGEVFRVLRASISLLGNNDERRVTLVTSSLPGEGKTFSATNLAIAYARQGTKTLLIDFDLRKPSVHKLFGEARNAYPGIVNVLTKTAPLEEALTQYEALPNLTVIFSGPKSPNPGELLEPSKVKELLAEFAKEYDHIVIDTAPLLAVPDTRILAPFSHNLALVVRADATPRKAVQSAISLLDHSGVVPDGILLNDYAEKRFKAGSYGYGYQEYGEEEEHEESDIRLAKPANEHF
ncbi:MAG: polysaccharide biosynthesis tyrosine autokinase [Verrucomicrobiaceae bacterium]